MLVLHARSLFSWEDKKNPSYAQGVVIQAVLVTL